MIVLAQVVAEPPYEEAFDEEPLAPRRPAPAAPAAPAPGEPLAPPAALQPPPDWEPKPVEGPELVMKPGPDQPEDPSAIFEEAVPPQTPLERANEVMDVRAKVFRSMTEGTPMSIGYVTLAGTPIRRKVTGLYVYYGDTNRHVLVTHDYDVKDFRAFVVDRITDATLLEAA